LLNPSKSKKNTGLDIITWYPILKTRVNTLKVGPENFNKGGVGGETGQPTVVKILAVQFENGPFFTTQRTTLVEYLIIFLER